MPIYSGPMIDAHMHMWDTALDRHPWLRPAGSSAVVGLAAIRRPFLPADYRSACGAHDVVATVHIEALWDPADPTGEIAWLDTLDKSTGAAMRYVAAAPFGTPEAQAAIERDGAHPRVAGFRSVISYHPTLPAKSWVKHGAVADDPDWRRDVALLARHGKSLDLMMYPYQAESVAALARALPELRIIVNHCGSPLDRDEAGLERWRNALATLAAAPNVAIKINMVGYDPNPTDAVVDELVLRCIGAFGTGRTMFASDWPVSSRIMPLSAVFDHFKRITSGFSAAEQAALFHDNAVRLYGVAKAG